MYALNVQLLLLKIHTAIDVIEASSMRVLKCDVTLPWR